MGKRAPDPISDSDNNVVKGRANLICKLIVGLGAGIPNVEGSFIDLKGLSISKVRVNEIVARCSAIPSCFALVQTSQASLHNRFAYQ